MTAAGLPILPRPTIRYTVSGDERTVRLRAKTLVAFEDDQQIGYNAVFGGDGRLVHFAWMVHYQEHGHMTLDDFLDAVEDLSLIHI